MFWMVFRVLIGIVGAILGLYIAFREGKTNKAIGIFIIIASLLQASEKAIELGNILKDYFVVNVPYSFKLSPLGKSAEVSNQEGKLLWIVNYEGEINNALLEDIDNDGYKEFIAGIGGDSMDTGKIFVHSRSGRIKWMFDTMSEYPYIGGSSNKLSIKNVQLEAFKNKSTPRRIVAISGDVRWYQAKIVILESNGKLVSEFWQPGQLGPLIVRDIDNDGITEIIASGNNNDFRKTKLGGGSDTNFHCVFLLKMSEVKEEAPPYRGKFGYGTQKWYKIILPQHESISDVEVKDFNGDGLFEIGLWLSCGYVYYLDHKGNTIKRGTADNARCDPNKTQILDIR